MCLCSHCHFLCSWAVAGRAGVENAYHSYGGFYLMPCPRCFLNAQGRSVELSIPSKPGSGYGEGLIENPEKESCLETQAWVSREGRTRWAINEFCLYREGLWGAGAFLSWMLCFGLNWLNLKLPLSWAIEQVWEPESITGATCEMKVWRMYRVGCNI